MEKPSIQPHRKTAQLCKRNKDDLHRLVVLYRKGYPFRVYAVFNLLFLHLTRIMNEMSLSKACNPSCFCYAPAMGWFEILKQSLDLRSAWRSPGRSSGPFSSPPAHRRPTRTRVHQQCPQENGPVAFVRSRCERCVFSWRCACQAQYDGQKIQRIRNRVVLLSGQTDRPVCDFFRVETWEILTSNAAPVSLLNACQKRFPHHPRTSNLHLSAIWFHGSCRDDRRARPTHRNPRGDRLGASSLPYRSKVVLLVLPLPRRATIQQLALFASTLTVPPSASRPLPPPHRGVRSCENVLS